MKRPTETIANLLTVTAGENDFDTYVNTGSEDVVVIASADVLHYFWEHYYEWSMFTKGDTLAARYSWLMYCYNEYKKEMQNSFNRIYAALSQTYDPTGDYSRHETIAYKNEHTVEYGKTATSTTTDLESVTEYNSTIGDDIKTYDSVSVSDARSQSKTGTDTTTLNGEQKTELSGTDTITDERLPDDNIRDVTGNNNSPQQAIRDEINLRIINDFTDIVLKGFADKYLFLLAEEC